MRISQKISIQTQFRIEQILFKTFYYFCRSLPSPLLNGLGTKMGALALKLGIRKGTVTKNLEIGLGDKYSLEEQGGIVEKCFGHFGHELVRITILDREAGHPLEDRIDFEGLEALENRKKPGGVLVGGHMGCWETANITIPKLGETVTVFTGKHANRVVGRWLDQIRNRAGVKTLSSLDDRIALYERAKSELVVILGDFKPPKAPVEVEFFGRPTSAPQGPALLSLLNDVDFIYFSCVQTDQRFKMRFHKIEIESTPSRKKNVQLLTQAYFNQLQTDVEKYPEQFFWLHRRWKDRPDIVYQDRESLF
ncbi:MAG: hypothetical protein GY866_43475 [Proteobacteria bacterium]|nr:hypothetical protein [Pseudomonadota bacterium]